MPNTKKVESEKKVERVATPKFDRKAYYVRQVVKGGGAVLVQNANKFNEDGEFISKI